MTLHTYSLRVFFNIVNRNKSVEQLPKQKPVRLPPADPHPCNQLVMARCK